MSSSSQPPKIDLDARAAELKEKLLRSRGHIQSPVRAISAQPSPPDLVRASGLSAAAPAPSEACSNGSSARTKPLSEIIAESVSPQAPLASLPADANDIADLISSISASFSHPSDTARSHLEEQDRKEAIAQVGLTSGLSSREPKPDHEPPMPASTSATAQNITRAQETLRVPTSSTSLSTEQPVEPRSVQATKHNSQSVAAEIQLAPRSSNNETIKQGEAYPQTSTQEFPEEGKMTANRKNSGSTAAPTAPGVINVSMATTVSPTTGSRNSQRGREPAERAAADTQSSQSTKGSSTSQELSGKQTQPTPTEPSTHNPPDGIAKSSHTDALVSNPSTEKQSIESKTNGNQPGYSEPEASDDFFARLLNQVPDLRDFLEMTDYYNVEARTRRLARFRRAKALAAEKRRIEEEERKLKEEEELEMELQRSTVARLTSAVPSAFSASDSNTLPTPVTPITKSVNEGEGRDTSRVIPVKRELEPETSPEARQEKVPRLEAPPSTRSRDLEDRTREDDKRDELYSRRELSPRHQDRHDQSPLPRPHYRDDNNGEDNRRVDRYRGEDSRYRESERRSSYPIHVDLGRKGDTRFFILKSFNEENVRRCMEDCLWTTQIPNAEVLSKAFAECKNVILFFSVNKSKAFQGYARMMSAPSPDNPRPSFAKGIHWETSDPFRVRWLSKTAVDFWRIGHIKNPYNDYLPVLVGKDGQEIEEECGAALLREMEGYAAAAESSRSYGGGKRPAVESYHLGRRESGGGRFYVDRYRG